MDKSKTFLCVCGSAYAQRPNLYRHRKTCDKYNNKDCESHKDVCSDNLNQEQLILLQADNTRLHELLRAQQEQIQKLDNKIQMQKQVAELQERERNMLIEQIKSSQHRENMFIEQIKTLQERERNMLYDQLKTLQSQLSTETVYTELKDCIQVLQSDNIALQKRNSSLQNNMNTLFEQEQNIFIKKLINTECNKISATVATNYVYLLQEREFTKTSEIIYKVGMTTKENHTRFNQYPKGSILIYQSMCANCRDVEKRVISIFKDIFTQRTDIGTEYFEGDYNQMINIIHWVIQHTC